MISLKKSTKHFKRININFAQSLSENERGRNTSQLIVMKPVLTYTDTRQRQYKKRLERPVSSMNL